MSTARTSRLGWYRRRLARMSPAELAWRARDDARQVAWSRRQVRRDQPGAAVPMVAGERRFTAVLPPDTAARVPEEARRAILQAADRLLRGEWEVLGAVRTDLVLPDWFCDPVTGRRAASDRYAFRIDLRSEEQAGLVKQVWEISRLQHLTLLATAWFLTYEEAYAERVAEQLRSWWEENPFLSGVNWTSGMELGIRLISLAWIRRLLAAWPAVADLFEANAVAVRQIRWHQEFLAAFPSRCSSATNQVIAEAAGQLVASCAFPWFPESERWRRRSALLLERELVRSTFPSGVGRDLASDYQCFIAELGLLAAVEAEASGHPLSTATWQRLCAMVDSAAALVDEQLRPPRQADCDEGRALLLDAPTANRWPSLLALGDVVLGRLGWWPRATADAGSSIIGALAQEKHDTGDRPAGRPSRFADAGVTLLRTAGANSPEIWCRCDGGPHGYLSIAAHAHAGALSVAVRYAGVDILADPDLYLYPGERAWRSYFRSTIASREIEVIDDGDIASWTAEHDGYGSRDQSALHRRSVLLDRASRSIDIIDVIYGGGHDIRLAFHLGPDVHTELGESCAALNWPTAPAPGTARLELPPGLRWSLHRGETDSSPGWYVPGLGRRVPAFTLLGRGRCLPGIPLITRLEFLEANKSATSAFSRHAISWLQSVALPDKAPEIQAEAR